MKENWVFPCNIKYFDIVSHFKTHMTVVWEKKYSVMLNDIVYLYLSIPYQEILYKCHVIDDNASREVVEKNTYAIIGGTSAANRRFVVLQLDYVYPRGCITGDMMKKSGISRIQSQRRIERKILNIITEANDKLNVPEVQKDGV